MDSIEPVLKNIYQSNTDDEPRVKEKYPHENCLYILYTKFYKMYTTDVYKIYTKCMQIAYRILINFCIYFVYKIKRTTPAKFCIQSVYKSLSKCGIHFVYKHFLYILYTKVCPTMGYILYTFCIHFEYKMYTNVCRNVRYVLYTNILCTFCIHQF